jgi:ABC-2 type transport system permease protein
VSVPPFLRQLRWENRKLWSRPRTYLGFAATLLFEVVLVFLYRTTGLDDLFAQRYWRVPPELAGPLSGPTVAVHVAAQTMGAIASLFLALVAGDIIANESEERTLHMIFSRPVSRASVLIQKVLACVGYTFILCLFVAASSLALALLVEGPGKLVMVAPRESIVGVHELAPALRRYALGAALLWPCSVTFTLVAFTLSCFRMKPGAATVLAVALFLLDQTLRIQPGLGWYATYSVTTRIVTWRQAFGYDVAWLRIQRNVTELILIDLVLVAIAWWVFSRRELAP